MNKVALELYLRLRGFIRADGPSRPLKDLTADCLALVFGFRLTAPVRAQPPTPSAAVYGKRLLKPLQIAENFLTVREKPLQFLGSISKRELCRLKTGNTQEHIFPVIGHYITANHRKGKVLVYSSQISLHSLAFRLVHFEALRDKDRDSETLPGAAFNATKFLR
ncbi:hypothetical protein AWC38_SpisGene3348 [Stylophora pistillata]|uniref:Uncharacterized protein n=1 Tax=Stylophora pistillata TaxID=50429 RepID=A0A2B4SRV6_STYPI|nr:hypothetical protein AWC38_SpisGene3348 [Stylophora pistillata]